MYRRSASIEAINGQLASILPSIVTQIPLQPSHEGRPISALHLHAGDADDRPGVLFVGGIHARELLNPDLLIDMVIDLLVHYLNNIDWVMGGRTWDVGTVRLIMETLDIFILPNANPDGREHVFDVARLWRKNRAPLADSDCVGVDLNRNYDLLWGIETVTPSGFTGTSTNPCTDVFVGPNAFSEPETQNVKTLLDTFPIDCMVDVHSYSELILHPWGHALNQTTDATQRFTLVDTSAWSELPTDAEGYEEFMPSADLERFATLGRDAAEAIRDVRGSMYTVQPGTGLYPTTGTTSDYSYSRHIANPGLRKVFGFTFETGPRQLTTEESFQPESPEAENIAEEATSGLVSILNSHVAGVA